MSKEAVYRELYSHQNPSVDTLFKIYQKDKFKARVYFMNENSHNFIKHRLGIFDEPNGDFNIVLFKRTYGISKSSIIYNRESRVFSIIKKGNKFYFKNNVGLKPLTFNHLFNCNHYDLIKNELVIKLPWLRYLTEYTILQNVSLNTIYSKKLFSFEKALKYEYKLPCPSAKLLYDMRNISNESKYLRYYVEYLINVENLHNTLPTYDFHTFYDTVKMGKTLNRKVNCSWSARRLKEEHDEWSKEITDIVFTEGDRPLNINNIFIEFSDMSGFNLLTTTKEMNIEGRKQSHCVATYVNKVDSGSCAIYSIDDYTLELNSKWIENYTKKVIFINQFRGYKNCDAPKELYNLVLDKLNKFNDIDYNVVVGKKDKSIFDIDGLF
jgi:hypothetical protein